MFKVNRHDEHRVLIDVDKCIVVQTNDDEAGKSMTRVFVGNYICVFENNSLKPAEHTEIMELDRGIAYEATVYHEACDCGEKLPVVLSIEFPPHAYANVLRGFK